MNKLKAALIGCGGSGKNHAIGYHMREDVELVGFSDIFREKAEEFAERFGGAAFASYEEMIAAVRPDIISVCTREYDHAEPVIYALSHGANVFCEKIMAHRLDVGEQMVRAAEDNDKLLGVHYNYRFIDSIVALKKYIEAGSIGELRSVQFHVHAFCHHHSLDLIRFLFGDPEEVTSVLTEDQAERHYRWSDADRLLYIPSVNESSIFRVGKLLITLNSCHRHLRDYPLIEIECYGTLGKITNRDMMINGINGRLLIQNGQEIRTEDFTELKLDGTFHRAVAAWVEAVQGKRNLSTSGWDGLQVMRLEAAISRSNREKRTVTI